MPTSVFDEAKAFISRSFIEREFGAAGAFWRGDQFHTLNPSRSDGTIGSFSIREDGKWYDFADATSGDIFDLLAARDGGEPIDAARRLAGHDGGHQAAPRAAPRPQAPQGKMKLDWKPIPEGLKPPFEPEPDYLTPYHDPDGRLMFYIARYNLAGGKKDIFPIYYTGSGFVKGLPPNLDSRPLITLDSGYKDKTVLVVEGEKCYHEAVKVLDGNYRVTTWHGGASQAKMVDLVPLAGCDVVLWPDNDEVGREAMALIADKIARLGGQVRIVKPLDGTPKGWDIADAIAEGRNPIAIIETAEPYQRKDDEIPAWNENPVLPMTDLGNAERFTARFGENLRYNVEKNKWMMWNGRLWDDSDQSGITPLVKATVRDIALLRGDGAGAWAKVSESKGKIDAMLTLASRERGIPLHEYDFDTLPFLCNAQNGIVDLTNGELRPHDRLALCSKMTATAYNASAKCPVFMRFLDDITMGREAYKDFMRRWFGYSLTADVSAQSFAIFYGNGANGKSTLVELVARIAGGYAKAAPPDTFIAKQQGSGIPNDVAALRGARLVLATETEANARLAESRIKSMTGGDVVSARFMRGEFFEFSPTWKIVISTNHRPKISGADYGIWRRIVLVPFEFIAQGERLDPEMPRKLWAEREGIFAWMVSGAVDWHRDGLGRRGLGITEELLQETQDYRQDEDIVGRFIAERCYTEVNHPLKIDAFRIKESAGDLYRGFIDWATDEGEKYSAQMTQTAFGRAMRERGYESKKVLNARMYTGIQLRRDMQEGE